MRQESDEYFKLLGRGESDPEYATVLLRICGIKEEWRQTEPGKWGSSVPETRHEVESLVAEIKRRVVENMKFRQRWKGSVAAVRRFLGLRLALAILLLAPLGCKIQSPPQEGEDGKPRVEVIYRSATACTANHGVWRWDVKTDLELPPKGAFPSDHQPSVPTMGEWEVPAESIGIHTPRLGREKEWFQLTGEVTLVKAESDGDLHVQLRDNAVSCADRVEVVAEVPLGKAWNALREEVFRWTDTQFPFSVYDTKALKLKSKFGPTIRVTGKAFFDGYHQGTIPNRRSYDEELAVLEIHPVMPIDVL